MIKRAIIRKRLAGVCLSAAVLAGFISGCGSDTGDAAVTAQSEAADSDTDTQTITVGFAQVGEESDWRRANSDNIKAIFNADHGYHLLFDDAQNNPENQIIAIRNFIQQGVDYIVLEPILESGWDTVLQEAKEANIPVIVADRKIEVSDPDLYTAWVGSDCLSEGYRVCEWLHQYALARQIDESSIRIVNIQGTIGSTPQIEREAGLTEYAETYGWQFLGSEKGEFVQAKGREAMETLLEEYPDLNVVYCQNDNEAYGAIDALEAAGKTVGTDIESGEIMILSFDATLKGLQLVMEGKIACNGECNPLHGPRIEKIIQDLEAGKTVEKIHYVDESVFASDDTVAEVTTGETTTRVTAVSEELLNQRVY